MRSERLPRVALALLRLRPFVRGWRPLAFEPAHYVMQLERTRGIERRAEAAASAGS